MFSGNSFLLLSISFLEKSQEKGIMRYQGIFEGPSLSPPTQSKQVREDWTSCPILVLQIKTEVITVLTTVCLNFTGSAVIRALQAPHTHTLVLLKWSVSHKHNHTSTLETHKTQPHNCRHLHTLIHSHNLILTPTITHNLTTVTHQMTLT